MGSLNRKIPPWVSWSIIGALLILIIAVVAYRGWEILSDETPASPPAPKKQPIRVPLFVDPFLVKHQARFHFTYDPPGLLKEYRESERLDDVIKGSRDHFETALRLMYWSRRQWEPGRPDPYPPINGMIILREIRAGRTSGFCAQYNYLFVQGLQSFSIPARYVTVLQHEVTEVWLADLGKWICFDPLYSCYYTDAGSQPLSVLEIYRRMKNSEPVMVAGRHSVPDIDAHLRKFLRFAVWLKNDHIGSPINFTDIERYKVYFVESPADSSGIPPGALRTWFPLDLYFDHRRPDDPPSG